MSRIPIRVLVTAVAMLVFAIAPTATAAPSATTAAQQQAAVTADPFYSCTGSQPLSSYAPGDVLKTRTIQFYFFGIPTPLPVTQLLYRTTDARGLPSANVTASSASASLGGCACYRHAPRGVHCSTLTPASP